MKLYCVPVGNKPNEAFLTYERSDAVNDDNFFQSCERVVVSLVMDSHLVRYKGVYQHDYDFAADNNIENDNIVLIKNANNVVMDNGFVDLGLTLCVVNVVANGWILSGYTKLTPVSNYYVNMDLQQHHVDGLISSITELAFCCVQLSTNKKNYGEYVPEQGIAELVNSLVNYIDSIGQKGSNIDQQLRLLAEQNNIKLSDDQVVFQKYRDLYTNQQLPNVAVDMLKDCKQREEPNELVEFTKFNSSNADQPKISNNVIQEIKQFDKSKLKTVSSNVEHQKNSTDHTLTPVIGTWTCNYRPQMLPNGNVIDLE